MYNTPSTERSQRKFSAEESVVKACSVMKQWLSNPSTPNTPAFQIKSTKDEKEVILVDQRKKNPIAHSDAANLPTEDIALTMTNGELGASLASSSTQIQSPESHDLHQRNRLTGRDLDSTKSSQESTQKIMLTAQDSAYNTAAMLAALHSMTISSDHHQSSANSRVSWNISDEELDSGNEKQVERQIFSTVSDTCQINPWLGYVAESGSTTYPCLSSESLIKGYKHDIDACSGELVPEIEYPDTLPDRQIGVCRDARDIAWRQANMTSELQISREIASRERLAQKLRLHLQPKIETTTTNKEEGFSWPNADCKLRPALPKDFAQIAAIINLERKNDTCPQILESKEVTKLDVGDIYKACRDSFRPFIVATPMDDELLNRSKWPGNAEKAYQDYLKFKRSQQPTTTSEVYGFAFVTDARMGFLGTPCPGSRFTAQIKIIVHPSRRKNLYGSALLDRILLSIAPYHRTLVDHDWDCPSPALVYETIVGYNQRQYALVYIENVCTGKGDSNIDWKRDLLEKFGFKQAAYFADAIETELGGNSRWLDLALWSHDIQDRSKIVEGVPQLECC